MKKRLVGLIGFAFCLLLLNSSIGSAQQDLFESIQTISFSDNLKAGDTFEWDVLRARSYDKPFNETNDYLFFYENSHVTLTILQDLANMFSSEEIYLSDFFNLTIDNEIIDVDYWEDYILFLVLPVEITFSNSDLNNDYNVMLVLTSILFDDLLSYNVTYDFSVTRQGSLVMTFLNATIDNQTTIFNYTVDMTYGVVTSMEFYSRGIGLSFNYLELSFKMTAASVSIPGVNTEIEGTTGSGTNSTGTGNSINDLAKSLNVNPLYLLSGVAILGLLVRKRK